MDDNYATLCFFEASDKELGIVLKVSVLVVALAATVMALSVESIFQLWVLSSDLVYVILFPNLLSCIYVKFTNAYGSMCSK